MNNSTAYVVCHSVDKDGNELITLELKFPHIILPQINKHRMINNNASSSRAVPTMKLIKSVMREPFIPRVFGSYNKGMQSKTDIAGIKKSLASGFHVFFSKLACIMSMTMLKIGVHKEHSGRYLEPFSFVSMVVTASPQEFAYMIDLRTKKDTETGRVQAQGEFADLAKAIDEAIQKSTPNILGIENDSEGSPHAWHLPYVSVMEKFDHSINMCIYMSLARCARVSYLNQGAKRDKFQEQYLASMLYHDNHASCFDHQGIPMNISNDYTHTFEDGTKGSGSFKHFTQLRHYKKLNKMFTADEH